MTLLNKIRAEINNTKFDKEYEANMVQSRLLSPIIEIIEEQNITQEELSKRTGLKQPFISALLNIRRKLNMEHIALFQNALNIVIQTPDVLSKDEHKTKFYDLNDYDNSEELFVKLWNLNQNNFTNSYSEIKNKVIYKNKKETFTHSIKKSDVLSYKNDLMSI